MVADHRPNRFSPLHTRSLLRFTWLFSHFTLAHNTPYKAAPTTVGWLATCGRVRGDTVLAFSFSSFQRNAKRERKRHQVTDGGGKCDPGLTFRLRGPSSRFNDESFPSDKIRRKILEGC